MCLPWDKEDRSLRKGRVRRRAASLWENRVKGFAHLGALSHGL